MFDNSFDLSRYCHVGWEIPGHHSTFHPPPFSTFLTAPPSTHPSIVRARRARPCGKRQIPKTNNTRSAARTPNCTPKAGSTTRDDACPGLPVRNLTRPVLRECARVLPPSTSFSLHATAATAPTPAPADSPPNQTLGRPAFLFAAHKTAITQKNQTAAHRRQSIVRKGGAALP